MDLKGLRVKAAHLNGRYSARSKRYRQNLEFRLVLGKGNKKITIIFIHKLITKYTLEAYVEFLKAVRNASYVEIKDINTDFEVTVSKVLKTVF